MSLLSGCVGSAEVDTAVDFRQLEDDEAQLQSIFTEAINLKKRVRQQEAQIAEHEVTVQKLQRMIRERDNALLQMELDREDEYSAKIKGFRAQHVESSQAMLEMKRQMNNAANETKMANTIIQGMSSRIKSLETEILEGVYRENQDVNTQTTLPARESSDRVQLQALRESTKKLIAAVKRVSARCSRPLAMAE